MKITSLDVVNVGVNGRGDWLIVRITTDEGLIGIGEASHGGGAFRDAIVTAILTHQCQPRLIGHDPTAVVAATAALWPLADGLAGATAVSACEQALWDIAGQAAGLPVHRLLGGPTRETIPLYANINRATVERTPESFARNAARAVAEGFGAVKSAPFDGMDRPRVRDKDQRLRLANGLACVAAIRDAVGPDIEVMVDCHSHFDVPTALEVAAEFRLLGVTWCEEPLPSEDIDGLARLRPLVSDLELIGGETLFGLAGFWPYFTAGIWDVIMPDVKHCGGISALLDIAGVAASRGVAVAPHNPSGPVAMVASAHAAAVMPQMRSLEYAWGEVPWRGDLTIPAERIVNGQFVLPTAPGLGIALDEDTVAAHPALGSGF